VLLWLHGGPGAAQMPVANAFNGALEQEFVVVHWDQRGAGKSNPPDFDESSMTFQQYLDDTHTLTGYLQQRFGQQKIYLLGHSWGSQIGLRLVQVYPEDYHAYIGVSQVIEAGLAQQVGYDWLREQIQARGDEKALRQLEALGKPPYRDHATFVSYVQLVDAYGGDFDVSMLKLFWAAVRAPEYNLADMQAWLRGANRGSGPMWHDPSCQYFNALADVPRLEIPVYFFNGQNDYNTPLQVTRAYFDALEAPAGKTLVVFENSAHTPFMAEAQKFNQELLRLKAETSQP
jgi:pimeloyl-ACP methyl ester carboxylesterase